MKEVGPVRQPLEGDLLTENEEEAIKAFQRYREEAALRAAFMEKAFKDLEARWPKKETEPEPDFDPILSGFLHGLGTVVLIALLYGAFKALVKLWAI